MENQEFIKGKIINYNQEKGFGFIVTSEKGNVFFHQSKLEKGFEPKINQAVLVQVKTSDKKVGAFDAVLVKEDTSQPKEETAPEIVETPFLEGTVKFYNAEKGFGFIATKTNGEVFFHISTLQKGYQPKENDFVLLKIRTSANKTKAVIVKKDILRFMTNQFIINPAKRKEIFEQLNEKEKKEFLEVCQDYATQKQLFDIWMQGFNLELTIEFLYQGFINSNFNRNEIFKKFSEIDQQNLLLFC
jgi:cold shock CspA family protein